MPEMTFAEWLAELDAESLRRGYVRSVTKQTGAECWRFAYEEGETPAQALVADEQNG